MPRSKAALSANLPIFYIWSPNYTHMHSGVRCLFLLCHHLNRLGYNACITGQNGPPDLQAPYADEQRIADTRRRGIADIVIYPEIIHGNPLHGQRVVRYLLNKPGHFGGPEDYDRQDYIIHFDDHFQSTRLPSRRLTIPLVDRSIFRRLSTGTPRRGYLIYSDRHTPDLKRIPKWVKPRILISRQTPREPEELANLYRQSRALVVWERTAAIGEAMRCGCPVMIIPHEGFDHRSLVRGCLGLGYTIGWNRRGVSLARRTVRLVEALFDFRRLLLDRRIHRFVRDVCRHFDSIERSDVAADQRRAHISSSI